MDDRWDVEDPRRPRRANRGNLLPELLEKGLNSEEEELLHDLSDATTDSTFSASGEEAMDEIDSDFSDEEEEGVLDGAVVETEAMVQRAEREERRRERQRAHRRVGGKGAAASADAHKTAALRLRPPPTIPLEERLRAARKRAREVRAAAAAAATENVEAEKRHDTGASPYNVGASITRRRRTHHRTKTGQQSLLGEEGEEEVAQRVLYTSSRSVLDQFGVPLVISFSNCLPRLFQSRSSST
ncbi:hypothetical protein DQ04_11051020 [Trypanosoma grayi]|uniref:hypothetical protein n=1 Tax=Trypanosoma grayi TaxID=71804 RepID=UPI0004F458B4|nr:hypothetical protein DQ04_11051020 [Trypanosoma grayi]KEG07066.1 hypothetical protein DQ04_11051020 [Trypanosoma grayi]